ncbi:MAG: hypothetical protein M3O15_02435 [Acidobacteriota bacterium]|nr:hypothetical protein [Acidobacteriota bacterium]
MATTVIASSTTSVGPGRKHGVVARRIVPYAPLALAMLGNLATGTAGPQATTPSDFAAAVCGEGIGGYEECHSQYPTGCSKAAKYDGYLNELKNLAVSPANAPVRWLEQKDFAALDQQTPHNLARDTHAQFGDDLKKLGEGSVAGLVGYLYYAQPGGKSESSNCQLGAPEDIDFHIGIGFDAALAAKLAGKTKLTPDENGAMKKGSVIVEMTPHWRARFQPGWSLDLLKTALGHPVRVVGQLLIDNEHYDTKDDCALAGASQDTCWRASVWELHPVTQFQVCGNAAGCSASGTGWVDLEEFKIDKSGAPVPPPSVAPPAAASPPAPGL